MNVTSCKLMTPVANEALDTAADRFAKSTRDQKLTAISSMIANIHSLANLLDVTRPDVSHMLDQVCTGNSKSNKKMAERELNTIFKGNLFTLDSSTGKITRTLISTMQRVDDVQRMPVEFAIQTRK
jgi:hypothetical protein